MKKLLLSFILISTLIACQENSDQILATVEISNPLNENRQFETVEISLPEIEENLLPNVVVKDDQQLQIPCQLVDENMDGKMDVILFQPEIEAGAKRTFTVEISEGERAPYPTDCFSRFVPERTDDYAWENNRVAFRTYGPTAKQMVVDGVKGGTLSSGIDAWLKRVEYPIIDKWYKKHTSGEGSYHEDTGEGLDNFHVGISRGVGGTAVKTEEGYAFAENFISYKTITNGPIRTSFILSYEAYDADGKSIVETKTISLDYGQNLTKYSIDVTNSENLSAGLTLHKKDGETTTNTEEAWASYWEPFDDSELGQGLVVADITALQGFDAYKVDLKDQSNLFTHIKAVDSKVTYYAGFGWKKSGQFENKEAWNAYLSNFSNKLKNPLQIKLLKK